MRTGSWLTLQGPVVRRPISANQGLNFNLGFYISLFKSRLKILFPICLWSIQSSIIIEDRSFQILTQIYASIEHSKFKDSLKNSTNIDFGR